MDLAERTTREITIQARIRRDIIDTGGTLTLRHNGWLHHIGVGRTHARTPS